MRQNLLRDKVYKKKFRNPHFRNVRGEIRLDVAARKSRAARSAPAAKIRRNAM